MKKIIKTIGWTLLALLVCYGLEVLFRALFGLALHKGMTKQEQIRVQIMANFILKLVVLFVFGFWYAVRENKWHYRPDYRPLFTVKRIAGLTAIGLFGQYAIGITVGFLRYLLPNIFASYDNVSEKPEKRFSVCCAASCCCRGTDCGGTTVSRRDLRWT